MPDATNPILTAIDDAIARLGAAATITLGELARLLLPAWQAWLEREVEARVRPPDAISCRAGCGACCRQPVPLSAPEAWMLAELVADLPAPSGDRIRAAFADAGERLELAGLGAAPLLSHGHDYMALDLPCPFLAAEACSIHPDRPAACREHLVVSPPARCTGLNSGAVTVDIPARLGEILAEVAAALLGGAPMQIPLVRVLAWCDAEVEAGRRNWSLGDLRRTIAAVLERRNGA